MGNLIVDSRVFPEVDDRARGLSESRYSLRGAAFGVAFPGEEVVRAVRWDMFEKICEAREAPVAFALIVEHSGA